MMGNEPDMRSEGDLNTSSHRNKWIERNLSEDTQSILDKDAKYFLHQSLSTPCLNVMESSSGTFFKDTEGRKYLDFHGNYLHNLGFGHPEVIEAITHQMQKLSFCTRRYTNKPAIELAEKLTDLAGGNLNRILFAPGGAEAMSMALKIARMSTGRFKTISMWDSFHGATLDTISLGGEAIFRNQTGPLLPGTEHVPFPFEGENPFGKSVGDLADACASYLEYILEKEGDICAVISETIRSSPYIPPKEFWQRIRKSCNKHGVLLILDEIPHALGRTGKMFTFQHFGIEPDMVVIGKGLGGGIFPLAAVIAKEELNNSVKTRAIGHFTHEKNPVASAAALALIRTIEMEDLLSHVKKMAALARSRMEHLKSKYPIVYAIRNIGLMMGIELRNPQTKAKANEEAETIMYRSLELGLNFKLSMGCIINLTPPINISQNDLEAAFNIIDQALGELE